MSLVISDEILHACNMEAAEFKQEIAVLLFQAERLGLSQASRLAELPSTPFANCSSNATFPYMFTTWQILS